MLLVVVVRSSSHPCGRLTDPSPVPASAITRKGVNRTLGTLCAGIAALLVSHLIDTLPRVVAPVIAVLFVFLGGAIPMFYRFRPPFKDRYQRMCCTTSTCCYFMHGKSAAVLLSEAHVL